MQYTLYFSNIKIGTVTQLDADFPNLSGTYELAASLVGKNQLFDNYIAYSVQSDTLMSRDMAAWEKFMEQEEHKYQELIDSENWKLIDEDGQPRSILIPIFGEDHRFVWRWS